MYQLRRAEIAAYSADHVRGEPIPRIDYTESEHAVWRLVVSKLREQHRDFAAADFLDGAERLGVSDDGIPQLPDIGERLDELTSFRVLPAPGLVPFRQFVGSLAEGFFHSTQYIRDGSAPFYSTEPDVLHEVIGHCSALAHDRFAQLYRAAGDAVLRVGTEQAEQFLGKVFWFTLECGLLDSTDGPRAYGASIMSSCGELEHFRSAEIRRLDIADMVTTDYDITQYQTILYSAESLAELEDVVGGFWSSCDDESIERLLVTAS